MITVKSHKRTRRNGVSVVKQHSRKGTSAYAVKENLGYKGKKSLSKKGTKGLVRELKAEEDWGMGLPKKEQSKTPIQAMRRALHDAPYGDTAVKKKHDYTASHNKNWGYHNSLSKPAGPSPKKKPKKK